MATATQLSVDFSNVENFGLINKHIFVVATQEDADAVAGAGSVTAHLRIGADGINTWTPGKGVGDWLPLRPLLAKTAVYVLVPQYVANERKSGNALKAVRDHLDDLGATVTVPSLPKGSTVRDCLDTADGDMERLLFNLQMAETGGLLSEGEPADRLYALAMREFEFYVSDEWDVFGVPRSGPEVVWPTSSTRFMSRLTNLYVTEHESTPKQSDVRDAVRAIVAHGHSLTVRHKLHHRVGRAKDGSYWLDLGREDGKVVHLSREGWTVEDRSPMFFRRDDQIHELPVPVAAEPSVLRTHLRPLVNVSDEDWPLLLGWMITHLIPEWVTPIALLVSEADAGKSTATMAVRFVLEGDLSKGSLMPDKKDDVAVVMCSERIAAFNNVSKISTELSDFLCLVIDGMNYRKRKLRTDSDVTSLVIRPSMLMNGISTGMLRPDLKTRLVHVNLNAISDGRRTDSQITEHLTESHPWTLGALLTLTCRVLDTLPSVDLTDDPPRMLDYARVLGALGRIAGVDDRYVGRYAASLTDASLDALEDPMFVALRLYMFGNGRGHGGVADWDATSYTAEVKVEALRAFMNETFHQDVMASGGMVKPHQFRNNEELAGALRRAATDWRRHGVTFERLGQRYSGDKRGSYYLFRFTPDPSGSAWEHPNQD